MGQGLGIYCRTCKVDCYLGYGSGRMFIGDWQHTLADYYKEVDRWKKMEPNTKGNPHIEAFLKLHDGHDVGYRGEYSFVRGKDLVFENPFGDDQVEAEGFDEYAVIERDELLTNPSPL